MSGLETIDQQIGYFDTLPEFSQIAFLNAVVKDIDTLGSTLDTLVDQWSKGDPDALAQTMNESLESTPDLAKRLLFDRNANRSEEHTSELQSLMRISYAVFCLKKQIKQKN